MPVFSQLTRGLNYMGWTASVNMAPGDALDARDIILRHDGSFAKHHGWARINDTALAGRPLAIKGFTFKGKNANDVRPGNEGIANDAGAANWTRRVAFYSGCILLTTTNCYRWAPATSTWVNVALPAAAAIDPDPKPTIQIFNDNLYIVGWTDINLRYDPVDEALYQWGWEAAPVLVGGNFVGGAGGALVGGAAYQYAATWVDLLTGEESTLSAPVTVTLTAAQGTVNIAAGCAPAYGAIPGLRHWVGAGAVNNDVGLALYRTGPDQNAFYFLNLFNPAAAFAPLVDNGLATDFSLKADTRALQDPPDLNQFTEWRSMWFGLSWDTNIARVFYNDFRGENSFIERWDPRDYREMSLADGETTMAVAKTDQSLVVLTNLDAYQFNAVPSIATGSISMSTRPLRWGVGCIGPKAWIYVNGWLYFLSDRGPYRWRPPLPSPQFIGKGLLPMFLDPNSGLCQLTEALRLEAEAGYDQDTRTVRFAFACGSTSVLNRHIGYWVDAEKYNNDPESGWVRYSTEPQCMDLTFAIAPLAGGVFTEPFDRKPRYVWGDNDGYIHEYDTALTRGALAPGMVQTGTAQAGSGLNLIVTLGGLYVTGDGMEDMRLEVVHTDGTIDIRRVAAGNTLTNIVPDAAFSQDPTGAIWYVGGIPSYWRSWVDSWGDPSSHKSLLQLYLGYNRTTGSLVPVMDVTVAASSEWPLGQPN
jgi:hypothetical protein